ncbi:MAG: hypothetical protein KA368_01320 [Acidobacteria bacterium]|nr:hypothetical protein [Acidobacteriota bacterium]
MSKGWKIGLSIAAGLMLVLMLGVGACFYFVSQIAGDVKEDQKAAERFGETADEEACLKETLARSKDKSGISAVASNAIFLGTCLQKSKPTPGFCDAIPTSDDKEATKAWVKTKCKDLGQSDLTCGSIYGAVIGHCQSRNRRQAEPEPTVEPEPSKMEKKK